MVAAVVSNSTAGVPHPDDPALKIPMSLSVTAAGLPASGGEGVHAYGYANGLLVTDTWTLASGVFVKTFSYSAGMLSGDSGWVKQ